MPPTAETPRRNLRYRGPAMSDAHTMVISLDAADSADARALIAQLNADLRRVYSEAEIHGLHPGEEKNPRLTFLIGHLDGRPVACGALRELAPGMAEVKRMYVVPECRGRGLSRQILARLEELAAER